MASAYRLELFTHPAALDVVGESHYIDALREVHRRAGEAVVAAALLPEPENAHDKNAIRVMLIVDGVNFHVGYLPREDVAVVGPTVAKWIIAGAAPVIGAAVHPFVTDDGRQMYQVQVGGTPYLQPGAMLQSAPARRRGARGPLVYIGVPIVVIIAAIAILTGQR